MIEGRSPTFEKTSAAYFRFCTKMASISAATAARLEPAGTLPAIKWILKNVLNTPLTER